MFFERRNGLISFGNWCIVIVLFSFNFGMLDAQQVRNSEPININFLTSTPWDVANSLRTPLGGPLSVVLAAFLSMVMLFGLLIAPVQYIFGDPARPYHIYDADKDVTEAFLGRMFNFNEGRANASLGRKYEEGREFESEETVPEYLRSFRGSAFYLSPEEDVNCQNFMICHTHGFLGMMPDSFIKIYQLLSNKIPEISNEDKDAILIGINNQGDCSRVYANCTRDILTIARSTFHHVVPRNVTFNIYDVLAYFD